MSVNWDLLQIEEVEIACRSAAVGVTRQYGEIMEYGDALQEAYVAVATNPEKVQAYLDEESYGYLNRWVWQRVTNQAKKIARRQQNNVSYEAMAARFAE